MNKFFDFGSPGRDETPVTIRTKRSMFLRVVGFEEIQPVAAGEAVTVPRWTLGGLIAGQDYDLA